MTEFDEPNSALILSKTKDSSKSIKSIFFSEEKKAEKELWEGEICGYQRAKELYGFQESYCFEDLLKILQRTLSKTNYFYFDFLGKDYFLIRESIRKLLSKQRSIQILNSKDLIGKLRLVKSELEVKRLKQAAEINIKAHLEAIRFARAGLFEYNLQALLEKTYTDHNLSLAYDSIVASGKNATVLHYTKNRDRLQEGQLVLIDAGCQKSYYASDITRTFPVGKRFTTPQKELYQAVLNTQKKLIEEIKAKTFEFFEQIQQKTIELLLEQMLQLGLIKVSKEQALAEKLYLRFYPHGVSHWLGLDVHDSSPYRDEQNRSLKLKAGMVLTIEPGLYFHESLLSLESEEQKKFNFALIKEFLGTGIRIEDDLLLSAESGCQVLTEKLPKEVEELEELKSN